MTNEPNDAIREAVALAHKGALEMACESYLKHCTRPHSTKVLMSIVISVYKQTLAKAGLVIAPRKATVKMHDAGCLAISRDGFGLRHIWQAMVAEAEEEIGK